MKSFDGRLALANINFKSSEHAYLTFLLKGDETILWSGHPESVGIADKRWILILGIIGLRFNYFYCA
jgi:hypothetical protein